MEWLKLSIDPLKDLVAFLYKKSKTNDKNKKLLLLELRDNLIVFKNGYINNSSADTMIDLLSNEAIHNAIKENFSFVNLKKGKILFAHIKDDRNKKYAGWTSEMLMEKIDEKITELKTIKKLNKGTTEHVKNNIPLMLSNLYFRMKLMADFIKAG